MMSFRNDVIVIGRHYFTVSLLNGVIIIICRHYCTVITDGFIIYGFNTVKKSFLNIAAWSYHCL